MRVYKLGRTRLGRWCMEAWWADGGEVNSKLFSQPRKRDNSLQPYYHVHVPSDVDFEKSKRCKSRRDSGRRKNMNVNHEHESLIFLLTDESF